MSRHGERTDPSGDYSRVREQLRYWPYTIHRIEDTLDIGLIEGKGRQLLFQAINSRNLTAFVGSGLSAAYGRLTWAKWQAEQFRVVREGAETFEALKDCSIELLAALANVADPAPDPRHPGNLADLRDTIWGPDEQTDRYNLSRWFRFRKRQVEDSWHRIEGLRATFERSKSDGGFPGGEELPLKFQIAQQLHDQLRSQIRLFMPPADREPDYTEVLESGWSGARVDDESSPPRDALKRFKGQLKLHPSPQLQEIRDRYTKALEAFFEVFSRPEARAEAEMLAKMLLCDERAHALITLRDGLIEGTPRGGSKEVQRKEFNALTSTLNIFDQKHLKRNIAGIRDDPETYRILGAFHFDTLAKLRHHVRTENDARSQLWEGFMRFDEDRIRSYQSRIEPAGDKRRFLTPSSRFIVSVYLRLLDNPFDLIGHKDKKLSDESELFRKVERQDFTSRRSIIANRFDPLAKTVRQLGITRYITTNYDVEIERFFQDMGYRKFPRVRDVSVPAGAIRQPQDDEYRTDPIGGFLLDQTFDRDRASDLAAFSVGDQRKDAAVFHLHGRATEKDRLVITERDYMNLYLLEDEKRDTVNEAITMAFSSAPLVFLGLGMEEADLLRPLRQFMSNRDRTIGYHALAILPGEKHVEERTKFSVTCFLRYGVHTIFYGSGQITKFDGTDDSLSIDWLCRILQLNRAMQDALKDLQKTGQTKRPAELLAELGRKVGFTNDGLSEKSDNHIALMALFNKAAKRDFGADPSTITEADFEAIAPDILSGAVKLQNCTFTPIRPDKYSKESRHYNESVFVEGDDYVGFATGLLNESLRVLLKLHGPEATPKDMERDIEALRLALSGLYGAHLTGALNAQLVGLEREWRTWWYNWQQSPPHRFPRFEHMPVPAQSARPFMPARFIRHNVSSIITESGRLEQTICAAYPFENKTINGEPRLGLMDAYRTGVRAFDTFIHAIHDDVTEKGYLDPEKRLLLTVAAYRGLGKGSFLTAMSSALGISLYEQATWAKKPRGQGRPFILAALFVNLSFSTEIASCFDMIKRALQETVTALQGAVGDLERGTSAETVKARLDASVNRDPAATDRPYHRETGGRDIWKDLERRFTGVSRMETIKLLFEQFWEECGKALKLAPEFGRPRLMIYLSGLELIYREDGTPKNAEIKALLDLVFDDHSARMPVDFIFVGSEDGLGYPFSQSKTEGRRFLQRSVHSKGLSSRAQEQIEERRQNGRMALERPAFFEKLDDTYKGRCVNHVHFARPVSPVSLLHDNFPTLALGLYINRPPALPKDRQSEKGREEKLLDDLKAAFRKAVPEGRNASDAVMHQVWSAPKLPQIKKLEDSRKEIWTQVDHACAALLREHAELVTGKDFSETETKDILRFRLSGEFSEDREEWRRIRRRVGNNRFITTLLLAVMEFMIAHASDPVVGAKETEEFIRATIDQVRSAGQERREEIILRIVLDQYRRHHEIGVPDLDVELHQLVLRHLGVIGCPVSSAVLVRLPEFRDYFRRIGIDLPYSRRRFLTRAMTVLAYRGLIFRLKPHPSLVTLAERQINQNGKEEDSDWPASEVYRYALHRTVQTYAIAKMGVGKIDPVRNNSFAPRLYVSMPSIGTGLSFESFQFLRSLLIGLSQYPDINVQDTDLIPWLFSSNTRSVRAQALRAALSMARSVISVATLSRFPAHADRDEPTRPRAVGLMETYKHRLRWIIRMAWELVEKDDAKKFQNNALGEMNFIQPLYRDEIVWLYNELGVVALTQGNLTEALGFLRQAAEFNEEIEGRSRFGPIFDYIDLNHAVVQIERGRLGSAQQRLRRIKKRHENDDKGALYNFAEGYLCVLDHIQGAYVGLADRFEVLIKNLQDLGDARATAIFMSHQARFLAAQNNQDVSPSLEVATALAETEGHEDIRHQIEIAALTIHIRSAQHQNDRSMTNRDALRRLRSIETYGQRMGIWNLQVDALRLRAELLLSEGETSSAGMLLVRAMAIAKRYRMMLRLTGTLTVYADLLYTRADLKGAERHALIALEMSKEIGYSLQTSLAQRILSKIDPASY